MSDQPVQLDLLAPIADFMPAVESEGKDKVQTDMYPNFAVGDQVILNTDLGYSWLQGKTATVIQLLPCGKISLMVEDKFNWWLYPKYLRKVRVHCPLPEDSKAVADTPTAPPAAPPKAPAIHYEIKEIKGRYYRYERWWDGSRHRSKYLGTAKAPN